jgi:hypothetical protein
MRKKKHAVGGKKKRRTIKVGPLRYLMIPLPPKKEPRS